jgi:replicative DNA helicase
VHSWADGGPDVLDEYERLNAGLAALRTVAGQLGCPVLAVAERNRLSMKSGGLSASAGSRKFEYGAESVWDLSVPEKDAPPVAPDETPVVLHVAKNRNGAAGRRVPLVFHGALQRFAEA